MSIYVAKQQKEPLRAIDATKYSNCTMFFGAQDLRIYITIKYHDNFHHYRDSIYHNSKSEW